MMKKEIDSVREYLVSYARGRAGRGLKKYVTSMAHAFVDVVFALEEEILLERITALTAARYTLQENIRIFGTSSFCITGNSYFRWQNEFHIWLAHLEEQGLLPGHYQHLQAKYTPE